MGKMTSKTMEKKQQFFGHYYDIVKSGNSVRLAPMVDKRTKNYVEEESRKLGISITEYMIYRLLSADIDDLLNEKLLNPEIYKTCRGRNNVQRKRSEKGCFISDKEGASYKNPEIRRDKRISMRVSSKCKEEIERRATELSLELNDFVALVFQYYDFGVVQ